MLFLKTAVSAAAITMFIATGALVATPAAFAQGERVDASGMPTTHSTPAEKADTAQINNQIGVTNAAADAKTASDSADYQAKQQQYQGQVQQNQAQQKEYQDRSMAYDGLRERYAAERAAYHRGAWPARHDGWIVLERDAGIPGERVQLISGRTVGTVVDTAHGAGGNVTALLVKLDDEKIVWIDAGDIRYNRTDGVVMTNLDRADLRHMADERL